MSAFLATDRCDRCGAAACVRTSHEIDGRHIDMTWCAHHAHEHRDALAGCIVDEGRAALTSSHSA